MWKASLLKKLVIFQGGPSFPWLCKVECIMWFNLDCQHHVKFKVKGYTAMTGGGLHHLVC